MPLTYPYVPVPVVIRDEGSQTMTNAWVGKYNVIQNSGAMDLTLEENITLTANAEIIIRNYFDSTGAITVVAGDGVNFDVSGDLGLVIPPGGIGELKRLLNGSTWSFYGYIEA